MNNRTKKRCNKNICFVAPGLTAIYSLLLNKKPAKIGGPDVHLYLLIRELVDRNFNVSIIVHNEEGPTIEHINGVDIIKIEEESHNIRLINIIIRIFNIFKAMKRANACTYVQRGSMNGVVSLFCSIANRRFIYSIASDGQVDRELIKKIEEYHHPVISGLADFGNWLDIKLADIVVIQNEYQRDMLEKNFSRDGVLIKKPFPLTERKIPEKVKPPIVLWVGSMAEVKQPDLFLKLAEEIPEAKFQIIGGPSGDEKLYNKIKEDSKRISNLDFLGIISFHEINQYFSDASILVNTSVFEAYPPYAFLQAWMNYTPIVSLHDNSYEILNRFNVGFHSKTFDKLVKDVKILLCDEQLRNKISNNCRQYVEREHDNKEIIGKYICLFDHD